MIENTSMLIFLFSLMIIQLIISTILIIRTEDNIKTIKVLDYEIGKIKYNLTKNRSLNPELESESSKDKRKIKRRNSRQSGMALEKDIDKSLNFNKKEDYMFSKEMKVGKKKLIEMNIKIDPKNK